MVCVSVEFLFPPVLFCQSLCGAVLGLDGLISPQGWEEKVHGLDFCGKMCVMKDIH